MAFTWRKLPVDLELPRLVVRLNSAMDTLQRLLGYTEPRGLTVDWNPGATLASSGAIGVDVSVPDAQLGDIVAVAFSVPFTEDRAYITGHVKSAGVVRAVIVNHGGSPLPLGAGQLAVNVWRA